ncbi:response regulator [Luteimonas viscosa]|uniref:Response regulator n=1 Tax=Luteimonas viscosa TaxID=1132694 RepID=A0A5D4XQF2_9GAMM|nr:response regulator [Luteimonas viscosa]TYT26183.1 response regulator [Luteimonas viscosa]
MEWRVLIVDDLEADDVREVIEGNKTVAEPDFISCIPCSSFSEAVDLLKKERFDLVILDLKDDAASNQESLAGERVFEELKKCRFMPVIFHTGYPHKVKELTSPFVKVVTRSEWEHLRQMIREVLATKLPSLIRHIEEEQRVFMWESAEKIWINDLDKDNAADLVFLLARRLANLLSGDVVRKFLEIEGANGAPKIDTIHAVELYIYPPISTDFLFGDIFQKSRNGDAEYYVALTPSCDHAQDKAEHILLARCEKLADTQAGEGAAAALAEKLGISNGVKGKLTKYIRDNSSPVDRFKYLPGTSFLPDLLIDLQALIAVAPEVMTGEPCEYERVASLDSPFAESLQAKLVRYMGRIGTPDVDADLALQRFLTRITPE